MSLLKTSSLEGFVSRAFFGIAVAILALTCVIGLDRQWPSLLFGLVIAATTMALWLLLNHLRKRILVAFSRANLHLEAIRQEDYNQHAKPAFQAGRVGDFHQQLEQLSDRLLAQKSRYDQHIFLVYRLIDQLDAPILVFNENHQLSYANGAFNDLYGHPWQVFRQASPVLLGLVNSGKGWHFEDQQQNNQWQIRHSEFIDHSETHQLLVFINIESALRENQLQAWQQIIRVLGHEIRNSLTPVSTLAQSLESKAQSPREKQALGIITERCQYLQDFVSRYSTISKHLNLSCQWVNIDTLSSRIQGLFCETPLTITSTAERLWCDATFVEQVLINLIKNAVEASAQGQPISLIFSETTQHSHIRIVDRGQGFANLDNLFVPFYSTKQQGQGIGLTFCRNIIEQHGGQIQLANNDETQSNTQQDVQGNTGVTVSLALPLPTSSPD